MDSLLGSWRLRFGVDVPWHEHGLEVVTIDDDELRGYITIDWRADTPDPDQRRHQLPFRASIDVRLGVRFDVVVGAVFPRRYRFELFFVENELVGYADVSLDRATAMSERIGVKVTRA